MSFPKKIAILTLSVGAGHVRAAEEVQRALADREDLTEARVFDAVELGSAWFRRFYVESYWWMLRRTPGVWRRLFERRQRKRHRDRKSTRLNSSHVAISYAVFCLKKKKS